MGLQQISQSSTYVCRGTDVSNTIEISFQQYGQVKKYSIRCGPASRARLDRHRLQFREVTMPRTNQRLNLFQSLRQTRYQSIWLISFETGRGFLCLPLESPDCRDKLDSRKASPHLVADHARRRECVRR
jgi:hypothetical protein